MAGSIFVRPKVAPINAGGVPYSGAKYTFYLTSTSTLASVYTDSALTTPHSNPVVADANGVFAPIWLDPAVTYRARLTTSSDVLIEDVDPIQSTILSAGSVTGAMLADGAAGLNLWPRTAAEILSAVIPTSYEYPPLNVLRYGADPTGVASSLSAFQSAEDVSAAGLNNTIEVPHGIYLFNGTLTLSQGTMIVGPGSQGSTQQYGCTILHQSNSHCFVWDGTGASNAGTGGGLKNVLILKSATYSGGSVIRLLATSDSQRPGEMVFENVLAYGTGGGLWAKGLDVDGTAANTAGTRGVRTLHFDKCRFADCTTNDKYVHFNQVTHVHGNIDIDEGSGTGTAGITIEGFWDNIILSGRLGNIVVNHSGTPGTDNPVLHIQGRASAVDNNYTSVIGSLNLRADSIANASKFLQVQSHAADAFYAYVNSTVANQTGNAAVATIVCNTEDYDRNSSYSTSTGVWTCKCAGFYHFDAQLTLTNLGSANTVGTFNLIHRDSGATLISNTENKTNVGAVRDSANQHSMKIGTTLLCAEGDTVQLQTTVSNGAGNTVGIGGAGTRYTYFCGRLLS